MRDDLDVDRLIKAITTVEWEWMVAEGRFPAPNRDSYRRGLRKQIEAMSEDERREGPMSNPRVAAEYERLTSEHRKA